MKSKRHISVYSHDEDAKRLLTAVGEKSGANRNRRVSRGVEKPDGNSPETHPVNFPQTDPIRQTMCDGKIRYSDKRNALTKINALRYERGVELRPYACPYCNGWHLTKKV